MLILYAGEINVKRQCRQFLGKFVLCKMLNSAQT